METRNTNEPASADCQRKSLFSMQSAWRSGSSLNSSQPAGLIFRQASHVNHGVWINNQTQEVVATPG
jgi:hypothetical protein